MDATDFDSIARALVFGSRRRVARAIMGGAVATLLGRAAPWPVGEDVAEAKRRKKKRKKKPPARCAAGSIACRGECVPEFNQCEDGTVCPRYQRCGASGCRCVWNVLPCEDDEDCLPQINGPSACRDGCCCATGPGGTYGVGPDQCNHHGCCSLRSGPRGADGSLAQCLPEE